MTKTLDQMTPFHRKTAFGPNIIFAAVIAIGFGPYCISVDFFRSYASILVSSALALFSSYCLSHSR